MSDFNFVDKEEATSKLLVEGANPVTFIGIDDIRETMDETAYAQISNIARAPGIDELVINPDYHVGYGTVVGSVFSSRDHVYPCAVGPDVACSMSFLQLDLPSSSLDDKPLRRAIIKAMEERIPLGPGGHVAPKARKIDAGILELIAIEGASHGVVDMLGIPKDWASRCEQPSYGDPQKLAKRLEEIELVAPHIKEKLKQIGGVGGGNHFQSVDRVVIKSDMEVVAQTFGLKNDSIGILNHFGSRGFGFMLTEGGRGWPGHFRLLAEHFNRWHIPFPGNDKYVVFCPEGTPEFDRYMSDMCLGANFAVVNHLLACVYVLEAFQELLGDTLVGNLVYHISHNIVKREVVDKSPAWVHRKGATRAYPAGHFELKDTPFYKTGHPILLPGNPIDGSTIMVGQRGSRKALNSVNHGAGRRMSRAKAKEAFLQRDVDANFVAADILTNCRTYPLDEAFGAYKPYRPVIESVEKAGLALTVAKLIPRMLLKDSDQSRETSA